MDELWYELTEEGRRTKRRMIALKCAYILFSIMLFLTGFFQNILWLAILGGCLIIIYDILDILAGLLNPTFPIIFAVFLAIIIKPWYMGVFWASAVWHIIGLPWYIRDLLAGLKVSRGHKPDPEDYKKHIRESNQRELERIKKLREEGQGEGNTV